MVEKRNCTITPIFYRFYETSAINQSIIEIHFYIFEKIPIGSCYSVSHEKKRQADRKRNLWIVKEEKDETRPGETRNNIIYNII